MSRRLPTCCARIDPDPRSLTCSRRGITRSDGGSRGERAPSRRCAPSQVFRACLLASCRSGCSVYSWLGRAPVADRRGQQPGRAVGTAHRGRNVVVEVQPAERGRQAHRHRRRWRGIHRRPGGRARRTGHQPGALTLAYKCARRPWMAHLVSPGAAESLHWLPFVVIAIHRQGSGSAGGDAICSSIRSDHAVISAS